MASLDDIKVNHILSAIKSLQYGTLTITIHDGEITQVERNEKKRFPIVKHKHSEYYSKS